MRKYFIIILAVAVLKSCGLTSKYSDGQHAQFAKMLSPAEKDLINQQGEIKKDIEFDDPANNNLLKGTLRILKTDRSDLFNFVEVGQWINHSKLANSGERHNIEFRDTITSDNLGNSVSRLMYYKDKGETNFQLGERWSSKVVDNAFIQHIEIFDDKVLIDEFDRIVVDFDKPKSDLQKQKVIIGTRKRYNSDGKLVSVVTYDNNGKALK